MSEQFATKREIDILVLSDIHLGTYGCHAKELLQYLNSIEPKMVVLNGDIIDIWQFSKSYWPASHMAVLKHLLHWMEQKIPVHYITGNHDEMMRKFKGAKIGSLQIDNKLSLIINGKKGWIFHGDVFDVVMQHSKWLAKLGSVGYDMLILINRVVNYFSEKMGRGKISLSKKVKNRVKSAVAFINKFENNICSIAADKHFDFVICGHIHEPVIKTVVTENGAVQYLNSGDWIENLTALEYKDNRWTLYRYMEDKDTQTQKIPELPTEQESIQSVLYQMMMEMNLEKSMR